MASFTALSVLRLVPQNSHSYHTFSQLLAAVVHHKAKDSIVYAI